MSSPNVTNGSTTQPNGRKRSAVDRPRVAIPLPLSKPRVKSQPKVESNGPTEAGSLDVPESKEEKSATATGVASAVQPADQRLPETAQNGVETAGTDVPANAKSGSAANSVSNGATPGPSQNGSSHPSTPPLPPPPPPPPPLDDDTPSKPASSSSTHKTSQIRTELPPSFVPAARQHTPQSSGSSINRDSRVFPASTNMPFRPGASSIIFGGEDSSASSPAPPQSAGSASVPPRHMPHRPSHSPAFVQPGHTHHASEPLAPHFYPSPYHAQHASQGGQRQPYVGQPPVNYHHPQAAPTFRYPPREHFTPELQNGFPTASRSDSPASASAADVPKSLPMDPRSPTDPSMYPPHARAAPFHRPFPPPQNAQPDFRAPGDNLHLLRQHVSSFVSSPTFSDAHLQVLLERDGSRSYKDAHRIIMARSPALMDLLNAAERPRDVSLATQVVISLPGEWIDLRAFGEALEWLYGGPLLGDRASDLAARDGTDEPMRHALAYVAAGHFLRLPAVAHRGVEVASSLLYWDTLEPALNFALDGGLNKTWLVDDPARGGSASEPVPGGDEGGIQPSSPTHDPSSTQLLHAIMAFFVSALPPNFYPDTSAPPLQAHPRLPPSSVSRASSARPASSSHANATPLLASPPQHPITHRTSRSTNDPRLSRIRFGELGGPATPSDEQHPPPPQHQSSHHHQSHQTQNQNQTPRPSPVTTTISSLLFSLPFPLLKFLLEHPLLTDRLGVETVGSIVRQVVVEREVRRAAAVKASRSMASADGAVAEGGHERYREDAERNLFWEESVEANPQTRLGLSVVRARSSG